MKRVNMSWCVVTRTLWDNESLSQVSEYVIMCSDSCYKGESQVSEYVMVYSDS